MDRTKSLGNARFNRDNGSNSGTCIEIRNMPLNASYSDIRNSFQGLYIRKDGLKIINDTQGNRVGIAYVKFAKPDHKDQAMNSSRYVRGSEVETLHLEESIFDKAVDSFLPPKEKESDVKKIEDPIESNIEDDISVAKSNCIVLNGLPPYAKIVDVAKLFGDRKIDDLFIIVKKDEQSQRMQFSAYVQFAASEDVMKIIGTTLKIGPKIVSPKTINFSDFDEKKKEHEKAVERDQESECILMKGLPFQTMDRDIMDFFSDIGIVPHRCVKDYIL